MRISAVVLTPRKALRQRRYGLQPDERAADRVVREGGDGRGQLVEHVGVLPVGVKGHVTGPRAGGRRHERHGIATAAAQHTPSPTARRAKRAVGGKSFVGHSIGIRQSFTTVTADVGLAPNALNRVISTRVSRDMGPGTWGCFLHTCSPDPPQRPQVTVAPWRSVTLTLEVSSTEQSSVAGTVNRVNTLSVEPLSARMS